MHQWNEAGVVVVNVHERWEYVDPVQFFWDQLVNVDIKRGSLC